MSKIYDNGLQQRLRDFIAESKTSQAKLSVMLDMSATQLSQYLNCKYENGDIDATERKIFEFLQTQEAREDVRQQTALYLAGEEYVPTTVSEDVFQSILYTQLNRCMAVLHGDAGVGKTKGAENFVALHPNSAIFITAAPSDGCLTGVAEMLAVELNIRGIHSRRKLIAAIREKLDSTNKVIIIDEAQSLTSQAIDELRSICDGKKMPSKIGNGVCLIGNSTIKRKIEIKANNGLAQLSSRVRLPRKYETSKTTRKDIEALFSRLVEDGKEKELAFLHTISRSVHSTRTAISIYNGAVGENDTSFENLRKWAVIMDIGAVK